MLRYNKKLSSPISVTDLRWEQIFLHVTLSGENAEKYDYFVGDFKGRRFPVERVEDRLVINIVNYEKVLVLPTGKWGFFAEDPETGVCEALRVSPDCGYRLEEMDKIYRYSAQNCMYLVSFGIWDGNAVEKQLKKADPSWPEGIIGPEDMFLYMDTCYARKNRSQEKRNVFAETGDLKGLLRGMVIRSTKVLINGLYQGMFRIRRRDGKHVLLMSETRTPMGGNLKALDDRIRERGLEQELHMSYHFSKTLEQGKLALFKSWLKLLWLLAGQDYVFVDDYVPVFQSIDLRPETKLIQLWHAGVGFKSVGYARFGRAGSPHPVDSCHRRYDHAVVGAGGLIPVYEEVFGIPRERFCAFGLPRLDGYNDPEKKQSFIEAFYGEHPQWKERKIILFAPTFRGNGQAEAYYPAEKIDYEKIYEMCGEEYLFALKMHPFVPKLPEIPEQYRDRICDLSAGTDINELFYVTEILITDFSSNIYEFALQNRPMLFYAYDKDYYQLTRGVHRRLEEFAPGKICVTFDELMEAIKNRDFEEERREKFIRESFDETEGCASDRIIDEIIRKGR